MPRPETSRKPEVSKYTFSGKKITSSTNRIKRFIPIYYCFNLCNALSQTLIYFTANKLIVQAFLSGVWNPTLSHPAWEDLTLVSILTFACVCMCSLVSQHHISSTNIKQNLLSNSTWIMNFLNLLIAYVLLHLLASSLGLEFHPQIASTGHKNVAKNSYVKEESTFFRLSTNHISSIDIATATIYIIKERCKLRLKPGKLVLLYLPFISLANSYTPEPNPGPRAPNIHVDTAKRQLHGKLQGSAATLVTGGTIKVVLVWIPWCT